MVAPTPAPAYDVAIPRMAYSTTYELVVSTIVGVLIVFIVMSNLLVLVIFRKHARLRSVRNWYILSMASADLSVGLCIMPLSLIYQVKKKWLFGQVLCEIWLAADVLLCTASIVHICVIGIDRYASLQYPICQRRHQRSMTSLMIASVWLISLGIAVPPLFLPGWRPALEPLQCGLSTRRGYILYSAIGSFYAPMGITILLYARVLYILYRRFTASRQAVQRRIATVVTSQVSNYRSIGISRNCLAPDVSPSRCPKSTRLSTSPNISFTEPTITFLDGKTSLTGALSSKEGTYGFTNPMLHGMITRLGFVKRQQQQKALFLIAIVLSFVMCWAPFFIIYLMRAFDYYTSDIVFDVAFFLGYCNSGLNPLVYALFNKDFSNTCKLLLEKLYFKNVYA